MIELERIRANAEAVFDSTADFRTALTWRQTSSVKSNLVDTPYWVQVDPTRPAPFTRHDFYSVSTYYYGSLTEAMVETFQTDQAQAVADFHAGQMAGIASLSTTLSNLRAALDAINPSMPIWPYEGGMHTLDDTTDDSWVTYTNDDAVPLVDEWRAHAAYQAEAQAAWWEAQKALDCACQYLMIKKTSGSGSWGLRQSMTEADEHGQKLVELAGQSLTASFGR